MSEIAACTLIQEEPDRKTERYLTMFKDYPDVVTVEHLQEMLCVSYGCCRSLRFKSQVLLSVMWHSIMLRMSISRIIWSVLWRCFSL